MCGVSGLLLAVAHGDASAVPHMQLSVACEEARQWLYVFSDGCSNNALT
jgi:hypothetical protein